jgi:poly(A) polymerase
MKKLSKKKNKPILYRSNSSLLSRIGEIADEAGIEIYVVGGYVRDRLMGRIVKDIDFTVIGDALSFATLVSEKLRGSRPVKFPRFGTAMIYYWNHHLDFVTARSEVYQENSRKPSISSGSLSADLGRRDFTVNTLAVNLNSEHFGTLIDLHGGVSDLEAKILRTPLDPETTFSDDPLRIMRAIRFAAQLEFSIEPKTLEALAKMAKRLSIISQERITEEMLKLMTARQPSIGIRLLYITGVLDVVFPEISKLSGVEQIGQHHHKDVFEHTLMVVDQVALLTEDPVLRLAALLHDIAKPKTKRFYPEQGWTFHGHEDVGSRMVKSIGKRMKLPEETTGKLSKLVSLHMRPINLTQDGVTDSAVRRLIVDAEPDLEDLLLLCRADITSANPKKVRRYLTDFEMLELRIHEVVEKDNLKAFQSPVRGEEIMEVCNLKPGPIVGKIKKALEAAILDGLVPNEHDPVLNYLHEIKSQYIDTEQL